MSGFEYSNLSTRPPGRFVTLAGRAVPGIARVQRDVVPWAQAWQRANLAAMNGDGPLWVALGDSLTQGIGASAYDRGWVGQLRDHLAGEGRAFRVVNLAVSGARTQDVLDVQVPALDRLRRVAPQPALVTLMIGSNDLVGRGLRDALPARMEQILRRLPGRALVTTLPNPRAGAVNRVIREVARAHDLVVADLRDPRTTSWHGKLAPDHFHPNDRGYSALADVLHDALGAVPPGVDNVVDSGLGEGTGPFPT